MDAQAKALAWLEKSEEDQDMANRALTITPFRPSQAAFHSQQAAEKALKGFLTQRGASFPAIHELTALALEMKRFDRRLYSTVRLVCYTLTDYAVAPRYPGSAVTLKEAKAAIRDAGIVCSRIRKTLGLEGK